MSQYDTLRRERKVVVERRRQMGMKWSGKKRYPIREENWGKVRHSGAKTFLGQNYTLEAMSREAHQICSQISNSTMYSTGWPRHIVHMQHMMSSNVHKCWKWRLKGPGWLVIERAWTGSIWPDEHKMTAQTRPEFRPTTNCGCVDKQAWLAPPDVQKVPVSVTTVKDFRICKFCAVWLTLFWAKLSARCLSDVY